MKFLKHARFVVIFALLALASVVQAGDSISTPVDNVIVSGNCDEITVQYQHSSGDFIEILVSTAEDRTITPDPGFDGSGAPFDGSRTFTFNPPLENGETVFVRVEVYQNIVITHADKNLFKLDSIEQSAPVLIAITEVVRDADCAGDTLNESPGTIFGCNDGRLNQNACEPVAIYSVISDDGIGMDVWEIDAETSDGSPSVYVSAAELAAAQAAGTTSRCTIATSSDGRTGIYLLAGGEIEVVHGPDFESKFFVFTFETYPSLPALGTYVGTGLPSASDC